MAVLPVAWLAAGPAGVVPCLPEHQAVGHHHHPQYGQHHNGQGVVPYEHSSLGRLVLVPISQDGAAAKIVFCHLQTRVSLLYIPLLTYLSFPCKPVTIQKIIILFTPLPVFKTEHVVRCGQIFISVHRYFHKYDSV